MPHSLGLPEPDTCWEVLIACRRSERRVLRAGTLLPTHSVGCSCLSPEAAAAPSLPPFPPLLFTARSSLSEMGYPSRPKLFLMRSQHVTHRGPALGPQMWGNCEVWVLFLFLASLSLHIHTYLLRVPLDGAALVWVLLAFCGPPSGTSPTSSLCAL